MKNNDYVDTIAKNMIEFLKNYTFDGVIFRFDTFGQEQIGFINLLQATKKGF